MIAWLLIAFVFYRPAEAVSFRTRRETKLSLQEASPFFSSFSQGLGGSGGFQPITSGLSNLLSGLNGVKPKIATQAESGFPGSFGPATQNFFGGDFPIAGITGGNGILPFDGHSLTSGSLPGVAPIPVPG